MLIYRVNFASEEDFREYRISTRMERDFAKKELVDQFEDFNGTLPIGMDVYLVQLRTNEAVFYVVMDGNEPAPSIEDTIIELAAFLTWRGEITKIQEIDINTFCRMVRASSFIEDSGEVFAKYGIEDLSMNLLRHGNEVIISDKIEMDDGIKRCCELLCRGTVMPELKRIFDENSPKKFVGHPVQYIIMSDSPSVRQAIRELLLSALWSAGRLKSRRTYVSLGSSAFHLKRRFYEPLKFSYMEKLYEAQRGGTIVLPFAGVQSDENDNVRISNSEMERIRQILPLIHEYRRDVLSIIEIERKDEALYRIICKELADIVIVKLDETAVSKRDAEEYLKSRAAKDGVANSESLLNKLSQEDGYILTDLQGIYDCWYEDYLHQTVFSCYRNIHKLGEEKAKEKTKGSAYVELTKMVGLKEAKRVIGQMLDFHRAQSIFAAHGKTVGQKPSMHMVFTGNPGTAKTTVARLVARIMKDNGLISVGNLVEVGRQDIVDRFVGGTAPKVKSLFSNAKGSVIFIDEAYSLVDGKRGLYGDEAINAIVQEMENHRDDTVVIFAGYPEEMEKFLDRNPGLRSRISFHVPFEDYSENELIEILQKFARDDGFHLSQVFSSAVRDKLHENSSELNARNGRLMRNIYEKAKMRQASRIVRMEPEQLTDDVLFEIAGEDFDDEIEWVKDKRKRIGFCYT